MNTIIELFKIVFDIFKELLVFTGKAIGAIVFSLIFLTIFTYLSGCSNTEIVQSSYVQDEWIEPCTNCHSVQQTKMFIEHGIPIEYHKAFPVDGR